MVGNKNLLINMSYYINKLKYTNKYPCLPQGVLTHNEPKPISSIISHVLR